MLDSIAADRESTATFEVFYIVFATGLDSWKPFEFTKSRSMRAGWINTILLDIQRVNIYEKAGYWPKRGGSCLISLSLVSSLKLVILVLSIGRQEVNLLL